MAKQTALITGITGQDGSYLAELLLSKGYHVCGIVRRSSTENFERIEHLREAVTLYQADLLDQTSLATTLEKTQPDEIYNLAAQSFVPTSWLQPVLTAEFTAVGIDPAWAPRDRARRNPSIGTAETTLLRRLNSRLRKAGLESADYRTWVRHTIVHETWAQRAEKTPVTLPPRARPWAEDVAERWITWAKESGVHVVGDLDDLRPTWPPVDAAWDDPDDPRNIPTVGVPEGDAIGEDDLTLIGESWFAAIG